jgi:CheY-like chemotaxis protein
VVPTLTTDEPTLESIPMPIRTVLLVDDDADVRRVASVALSRLRPWRVLEAGGANEGLAIAARERPDLVLLDVTMPGVDGISLLKSLRELEGMRETPVIFITAHVLPTRTSQLAGLGATGVITKPFVAKNLPAQIEALVEGATGAPAGALPEPKDAAIHHALAEARDAFRRELPAKLDALEGALAKLEPGREPGDALEDARIRAHKLAGSAGTYGLAGVSAAARRIEELLLAVRGAGGPPDRTSLEAIASALAEARSSA